MAPKIVIVGGGFGGLYCAKALAKHDVPITLLDRRNYHLFQPLLYQVAMGGLHPADIATPIRYLLKGHRNVEVLMAGVERVDRDHRQVLLDDGTAVPYDYLVLAPGSETFYFGHSEWENDAPGLKTVEDALEIRRRVLSAFERAEREPDPEAKGRLLTFVVIGGGPTGVELAGALAEVARRVLPGEFRHIDPASAKVVLLEGGPRLLPTFPEDLATAAVKDLNRLGVQVCTSAKVGKLEDGHVDLGDKALEAGTVLWAAGVRASRLGKTLGAELDKTGRVIVEPDCSVPGSPEVFVIGDLACFKPPGAERPLPGVAPVAIQQGKHVAATIWRAIGGFARQPFHYVDKGNLATIGRAAAIADLPGGIRLSGLIAWAAWVVVHILYLIGFRNRLFVLLQWAWAYLNYDLGVRLITEQRWEPEKEEAKAV